VTFFTMSRADPFGCHLSHPVFLFPCLSVSTRKCWSVWKESLLLYGVAIDRKVLVGLAETAGFLFPSIH
jgi:hypothetical protein